MQGGNFKRNDKGKLSVRTDSLPFFGYRQLPPKIGQLPQNLLRLFPYDKLNGRQLGIFVWDFAK
jgi:hypothetical protein